MDKKNDKSQSIANQVKKESKKIGEDELASTFKKNSKPKKARNWKTLTKIYLVPIFAIILFVYIVFGLIFQKVSNIFEQLDVIEAKEVELEDNQNEIANLQAAVANTSVLQSSLNILNSLAPSAQTEVVEFQEKVEFLAIQNNLTITSQRLSDQASGEIKKGMLSLSQIPNVFEIIGNKSNIDSFLNDFSNIDDFLVVSEMQYSGVLDQDSWRLKLTTIKYQFGEANADVIESYELIPIESTMPTVVDEYIQERL